MNIIIGIVITFIVLYIYVLWVVREIKDAPRMDDNGKIIKDEK